MSFKYLVFKYKCGSLICVFSINDIHQLVCLSTLAHYPKHKILFSGHITRGRRRFTSGPYERKKEPHYN